MTNYESAYKMPTAAANAPQLRPRTYSYFELTPLSGALGAEVTGVDLKGLGETGFGELREALNDHQVLTIRGQNLTPASQSAFAARFGALMHYDFVDPMPGHPFVTELRSEPEDIFNFGGGWHSDSMNYVRPPALTILYCVNCPAVGGDTAFSNLYLAWESLSPGLRNMLRPMKQITATTLTYGSSTVVGTDEYRGHISTVPKSVGGKEDDEFEHPVARTHPETGRLALYVCSAYTARFRSMTRSDSLPLLRHLFEQTYQPEFTCRVSWQPGTLTIWDNRCVVHYAHNDYPGSVRFMRRVIVEGERPY